MTIVLFDMQRKSLWAARLKTVNIYLIRYVSVSINCVLKYTDLISRGQSNRMCELTVLSAALTSGSFALGKTIWHQRWKFSGVYYSLINNVPSHLWSAANTPAPPWACNGFSQCACESLTISRRGGCYRPVIPGSSTRRTAPCIPLA